MAKKIYVGVNGIARKVKKIYTGIPTDFPIYETTTTKEATPLDTATKLSQYLIKSDGYGGYGFDTYSSGYYQSNNGGVGDSTAELWLTAKEDIEISFDYSYSSEANLDKFTLEVAGVTIEDAVSGATTKKNFTGTLLSGQQIYAKYTKDSSGNSNNDQCKLYNFMVYLTKDTQVQIGTETKQVARKVKKAYIGIGGVARPCFTSGELTAFGTTTSLSVARYNMAATSTSNYAFFGGGWVSAGGIDYSTVDVYSKSLTKAAAPPLSEERFDLAASSVGDYAIFCGGYTNGVGFPLTVNVYNNSLTKCDAPNIVNGRRGLSAANIGDYALFAGGLNDSGSSNVYTTDVDVYSSSLTRITKSLSQSRAYLAATCNGDYALFGGGRVASTYYDTVDAYDKSLTRYSVTSLSQNRSDLTAASVGGYALFGGGYNYSGSYSFAYGTIDVYDKSLTRTTGTSLSQDRSDLTATSVGGYALFGGGYSPRNPVAVFNTVDVYDTSLTRTIGTPLSNSVRALVATSVGDYALFAGGNALSSTAYDTVDVYMV